MAVVCPNVIPQYAELNRKPGRSKRPGFFIVRLRLGEEDQAWYFQTENKGRYEVKFLMIMLAIRLIFSLLDKIRKKETKLNRSEELNDFAKHPAEFQLREDGYRIEWWW